MYTGFYQLDLGVKRGSQIQRLLLWQLSSSPSHLASHCSPGSAPYIAASTAGAGKAVGHSDTGILGSEGA